MKITVWPNQEIEINNDETLLQALQRENIPVANVCSGQGTCGKCKVRILKGIPNAAEREIKYLNQQELNQNIRLACQVKPQEGMLIQTTISDVEYDRKEAALYNNDLKDISINSGINKVWLTLEKPSLEDSRGNWERLAGELRVQGVEALKPSLEVLRKLPNILQTADYSLTVVLWENQILDIEAGDTRKQMYGIAIDIGTTSVAMALVDLCNGQVIKVASSENSQTAYGADVISRITYANKGLETSQQLQSAIKETINKQIARIVLDCGIDASSIYKLSVVGNTTMQHLFLGLDVKGIAVAPFVSVCTGPLQFLAQDLDLQINPSGRVLILPNIGSFVGSDTLGAVLGTENILDEGNHLLIDLGTNCELFLKANQQMMACSTAAGPAFEGARIGQGMRAKPGAIEGVKLTDQGVSIEVIGEGPAIGICGSGLIETIAQMKEAGIINAPGKFDDDPEDPISQQLTDRIRENEQGKEFVLFYASGNENDVVLSQKDIGELQLAKGAVCAGVKTLLDIAGISLADLDSVVLAGTFATYLDIPSVLSIGLVPNIDQAKICTVGNAAHRGALRILMDQAEWDKAENLAQKIKHIELGGSSLFSNYYMDSMFIEPTE